MSSWVAKPVETKDIREGTTTICRSTEHTYLDRGRKAAYVDPLYRVKAFSGLPKLLMPYSHTRYIEKQTFGSYKDNFGNVNKYTAIRPCNQGWKDWSSNEADFSLRVAERASNIFYSKLSDRDTFNAAVSIAELGQTVGLVASTAARLNTAISSLRKGKITQAFRTLGISDSRSIKGLRGVPDRRAVKRKGKDKAQKSAITAKDQRLQLIDEYPLDNGQLSDFVAKSWLELQYGWTPLLNDVYGAAELAAKLLNESPADFVVKATYRDTVIITSDTLAPYGADTARCERTVSLRHKYIAYLKIGDPEVRLHASLGLSNPALFVWEKIPFSFVADWFLPVGAFLDNIDALRGYDVVQACHSTKYETYNTYVHKARIISSYSDYRTAYGTVIRSEFKRAAGTNQVPSVALPSFQLDLGWDNAATAVSLLKVLTS